MIISDRPGNGNRAAGIGLHQNLYVIAQRIVAIKREDEVRMLFAQLTHVPIAKQKWNYDESCLVADVLNFLEIHQRKSEAIAADQQD